MSTFAGAAVACGALVQRDLRAFARSRSQLYSSLLLPLMLLAILGTGVSDGLDPASDIIRDGDYISYLAPGMIAMTALFSSTFSSASFYRDRESGMLRALLASPHDARTILLGKALAAVTIGTAQALLILAVAAAIPGIDLAWQYGWLGGVAMVLAGILALNFLLSGISLLLATRIRTMQGFHLVMNLALFPLFFLSGAFFPLEELPTWLRVVGWINPLTYPVDLMQTAAYAANNNGFMGPAIDFAVLGSLALVLFGLGLRRSPRAT
ncbi:MAG: ABC transporter permease [Dehalococcoidia bacterium]